MKTRRTQPWLILAALVVIAPILSGCADGGTVLGASWPGLTIIDDTVFLSYARVYAFDTDGTPKWSFPGPLQQLASNQAFFAPPAADDQLVVVTDYTDKVFGLDPASGTQKWYFESNKARFIGGPVLGDKLVYAATSDGIVHAIDRSALTPTSNGDAAAEAWSYTTDGSIWGTPLLADGTLYVTSMDRHVYALDAETGKLRWKFPDENSAPEDPPLGGIVGTPTLYEGVLYFGSFNNHLYALDVETHRVLWRYDTTNWVWGSPVVDAETGYVIAADLDGNIFAIDPASGGTDKKAVWSVDAKSSVVGSPVLRTMEDGTTVLYITSEGDPQQPGLPNLYVLNAEDGQTAIPATTITYDTPNKILGLIDLGTVNTRPVKLYPSPVFADSTLIVAAYEGDHSLFAMDDKTLDEKWKVSLKETDTKLKTASGQPVDQGDQGLFGNPTTLLLIMVAFLLITLVMRPQRGKK